MSRDYLAMASELVDTFLGGRLEAAGEIPGLRDATVALTARALENARIEQLMRQQLDQLTHLSSKRIPDAYLADEAATEDALQRAAAGIRMAAAANGRILDPSFERAAARRLGDNPRFAIRAEIARIPRPVTRPEALRWSIESAPWADKSDEDDIWLPNGLNAASQLRCLPGGASALARVEDGPHEGWIQIGMIERHLTPARRYPARPSRLILISVGLEITETSPPAKSLPFAASPWLLWVIPWQHLDPAATADAAAQDLSRLSCPLVALADDGRRGQGSRGTGPGTPPFHLAPVLAAVITLGLWPTPGICGFSLSDDDGPGLIGRQWRGHLVHDGNYEPLMPAVEGADLIIRPDLFAQLLDIVGKTRVHSGISASYKTGERKGQDG
jgi:hypothetical protein